MSEDLENTLMELGPEYAGTVARLRVAREAEPSGRAVRVLRLVRLKRFACAAAMFAAAAGLLWVLCVEGTPGGGATAGGAKCPNPYSLAFETPAGDALKEIKRTQNPDGSWISDGVACLSLGNGEYEILMNEKGKSITENTKRLISIT